MACPSLGSNQQISDGPFAEAKEIDGGYLAIKAADLIEAIEVAKGCPIFDNDGITEVREVASESLGLANSG
jgi:hypothetical protein